VICVELLAAAEALARATSNVTCRCPRGHRTTLSRRAATATATSSSPRDSRGLPWEWPNQGPRPRGAGTRSSSNRTPTRRGTTFLPTLLCFFLLLPPFLRPGSRQYHLIFPLHLTLICTFLKVNMLTFIDHNKTAKSFVDSPFFCQQDFFV